MDERSQGIVLRVRPLTETSLIVQWITRDQGRIATVAKGARRPKSPFAGKLDLYFLAEFSFQRSRRSDLHTLREVAPKNTHPELRKDIHRLQQAAYAVALLELASEPETPLPELYELWAGFLSHLQRQPAQPLMVIGWEMKLLDAAGLQPDLSQIPLGADCRRILEQCLEADWMLLSRMQLTPAQTGEIAAFLRGFLTDCFGRIPRQREAALRG
jgi:DNA repair protein RecO (recombination protein O)